MVYKPLPSLVSTSTYTSCPFRLPLHPHTLLPSHFLESFLSSTLTSGASPDALESVFISYISPLINSYPLLRSRGKWVPQPDFPGLKSSPASLVVTPYGQRSKHQFLMGMIITTASWSHENKRVNMCKLGKNNCHRA